MDLVVPDGQPVRSVCKWHHTIPLPDRVYGPRLMFEVCARATRLALPIFGKPVVTTPAGAEDICAGQAAGSFVRGDPAGFAHCVLWLLRGKRYLDFKERARAFIRKPYDWPGLTVSKVGTRRS